MSRDVRDAALWDLVAVALFITGTVLLSLLTGWFEGLVDLWVLNRSTAFDEVLALVLVLLLGGGWYSLRRWREVTRAMEARDEAERTVK